MEDDTELSANETITFTVSAFGIIVYAKVGNALIPPTAKEDYYSADVNQPLGSSGGSSGGISTGHASFQITLDDELMPAVPVGFTDYVNVPCGFVPYLGKPGLLNQIRSWPGSTTQDSPSTTGKLEKPDGTAEQNREFGITHAQMRSALDKIASIHDSPPDYVLHSNNCVDVCISVASAAGVYLGKCRYNVVLRNADTNGERMQEMALPDELAKALQK